MAGLFKATLSRATIGPEEEPKRPQFCYWSDNPCSHQCQSGIRMVAVVRNRYKVSSSGDQQFANHVFNSMTIAQQGKGPISSMQSLFFPKSLIELQNQSTQGSMTGRVDAEVDNSECDARLALGREALGALLFAVPEPNLEAVHALLPNRKAETGSIIHPFLELVSLIHSSSNRYRHVLTLR